MTYDERNKQLRRIITCDGKGVKMKAQFLLELLNKEQLADVITNLEEISGESLDN